MIEIHLNERLKERGKTLYWLSQETQTRYATIWSLARNEVGRLSLDTLDRICEALDCQPGDLLVRTKLNKTKSKGRK